MNVPDSLMHWQQVSEKDGKCLWSLEGQLYHLGKILYFNSWALQDIEYEKLWVIFCQSYVDMGTWQSFYNWSSRM